MTDYNSEEEEIEKYDAFVLLDEVNNNIEMIWKDVILNYINNPNMEILQHLREDDCNKFNDFFKNNSIFYKTIIEDIKIQIKAQKEREEKEEEKEKRENNKKIKKGGKIKKIT
jgi:hypothetical protein